jgi:hypothetical protein
VVLHYESLMMVGMCVVDGSVLSTDGSRCTVGPARMKISLCDISQRLVSCIQLSYAHLSGVPSPYGLTLMYPRMTNFGREDLCCDRLTPHPTIAT